MKLTASLIVLACLGAVSYSCVRPGSRTRAELAANTKENLTEDQRLIAILATNDIHGGLEPSFEEGNGLGGMSIWSGIVNATRLGLNKRYGDKAGMLLLDAGDQFQGTLISNYDEGKTQFKVMSAIGYDAIIPGNHDYDFGPTGWKEGWLNDKISPEVPAAFADARGALKELIKLKNFPLLSANTYLRDSLVDSSGAKIGAVDGVGCIAFTGKKINWAKAKRPEFLETHMIKTIAGVRVAVIGIDHQETPRTTTAENVSDLCFRHESDAYQEIQASIADKADVFIMLIHNSDLDDKFVSKMAREIYKKNPNALHAVVAGHTHKIDNLMAAEDVPIPIIQSQADGKRFGRIDLIWNTKDKKIIPSRIRYQAGMGMYPDRCDPNAWRYCEYADGKLKFEGETIQRNPEVVRLIKDARDTINPFAKRRLGSADAEILRSWDQESPMSNAMSDLLVKVARSHQLLQSNADLKSTHTVAFVNTGGLRKTIVKGEVDYESLFKVLPFANRAYLLGPVTTQQLVEVLIKAGRGTDAYGNLMQSGLRVQMTKGSATKDPILRTVTTADGKIIFDGAQGGVVDAAMRFSLITFDFLTDPNSKVPVLSDAKVPKIKLGIARELIADYLEKSNFAFPSQIDQRWKVF